MANVNAPFGGAPVKTLHGGPFNARGTRYYIPSTDTNAYYIGDFVTTCTNQTVNTAFVTADANGVPGIGTPAAGSNTMRGIIVGVEISPPNAVSIQGLDPSPASSNTSIPATKTRDYYVFVQDAPDIIFMIQGDGTATNQTAAKASYKCSLTLAAPSNTAIGNSATVIASSTIATTKSLNIQLLGLAQVPGNAFGAYAKWLAMFNLHEFNSGGIFGS